MVYELDVWGGGEENWENKNCYQPFEDIKRGPLLKT